MMAAGLLISCATPLTSCPMAASFSACWSCGWVRFWSVTSRARASTRVTRPLSRTGAYSLGTIVNARIGKEGLLAMAMEPQRGSITPSLVDGRLPQGPDEAALGTETMHRLGVGIGDTAPFSGKGGDFRMRVVGRIVMPTLFFSFNRPGQGAVLSLAG